MHRVSPRWRSFSIAAALLTAFFCLADSVRAVEFKTGAAVVDITPPVGYRMAGYFSERLNTGAHDPLLAKAVFFEQGTEKAALVFCDLCDMSPAVVDSARKRAAERTGVPADHVLVAATHSHTGPCYWGVLRDHFHEAAVKKNGTDPCEEVDYRAWLAERIAQAIVDARAASRPARLAAGTAEETRLSFNRRFHVRDGTVVFNPGKLNKNIVRPAGPIDPEIGLLVARDAAGQPLACLTVFALHLDTVGGTEYSADYPHYLSAIIQAKLGRQCVSLFGNGTCGDINHVDVSHDRPQKGHEEARRIGEALAATVLAAEPRLPAVESPSLAALSTQVSVEWQARSPEQVAAARADMAYVGTSQRSFLEQVETCKTVALADRGDRRTLEVQAFRLSDSVAIVGLPGEVFVELGLAIKQASPFATTMVIELCNDDPAYVPTLKGFAEGSYEVVNSQVAPGGGEKLVEAALRLLADLAPGEKK